MARWLGLAGALLFFLLAWFSLFAGTMLGDCIQATEEERRACGAETDVALRLLLLGGGITLVLAPIAEWWRRWHGTLVLLVSPVLLLGLLASLVA